MSYVKIASLLLLLVSGATLAHAQNVGIGINAPTEKLHIYNPGTNPTSNILYIQNEATGARSVIRLKTAGSANRFQISKIAVDEFVNMAGVSIRGGVSISNEDNGPMMIGNFGYNRSIHFATDGRMRLTIDGPTGALLVRPSSMFNFTNPTETDLGIRRDTLTELQTWLELRDSSSQGNMAAFLSTNQGLDGYGARVQIGNNAVGTSKVTFWTNVFSPSMFIHDNGNVAIGMPSFNDPGAKLYVNGQVKITDGQQSNGRVLTSDNAGLARWADLPGGASSWAITGNNISNTNTGSVGIGTATLDPFTKLQVLVNSGDEGLVKFQTTVNNKGMGLSFKNPDGQWTLGQNIGNYPDNRFNLFFSTSLGASTQMLTVTKEGNVGIGDYTGIGVAPTERLEIKNGFMKVSGANKTAFTVTATAGNSGGHILNLSYANQAATDILIVTHNYSPPGGPSAYHNYNVGVYWNGGNWSIYNENTAIPIIDKSFNVLVIKQ